MQRLKQFSSSPVFTARLLKTDTLPDLLNLLRTEKQKADFSTLLVVIPSEHLTPHLRSPPPPRHPSILGAIHHLQPPTAPPARLHLGVAWSRCRLTVDGGVDYDDSVHIFTVVIDNDEWRTKWSTARTQWWSQFISVLSSLGFTFCFLFFAMYWFLYLFSPLMYLSNNYEHKAIITMAQGHKLPTMVNRKSGWEAFLSFLYPSKCLLTGFLSRPN